jgi:small conductance mechanosensitive channel
MTLEPYIPLIRGLIYLVAGYFIARIVSETANKLNQHQRKPRYSLFIEKAVFYLIFVLFVISALRQWGFDLKVLLGATGILTIALGFASQTSASNFISGLFLLSEDTLHVGDLVEINGTQGRIISIDLFSVKIKQSDNTLVRIPNETLLKTLVINLSHFPERRYECNFNVPGSTDITRLKKIVLKMLSHETLCLKTPAPTLLIKDIGNTAITMKLWAWATQNDFGEFKYKLHENLVETLRENNIAISDSTVTVKLLKEGTHDHT